ncbi:MAG: hypothetical protein HYT36_02405 [Candidatus Staskawiczbacteria bacterium]|nr:hypothetical protein [Candidatus Staskawiczbacteria bacterium]
MKRLSYDQKVHLEMALFSCGMALMLLGFILGVVAAAMEKNTVILIITATCMIFGTIFILSSQLVKYRREILRK